jgi:hypothetical protein
MRFIETPETVLDTVDVAAFLEEELKVSRRLYTMLYESYLRKVQKRDLVKGLAFLVKGDEPVLVDVPIDAGFPKAIATAVNVDGSIYLHRTPQRLARVYNLAMRARKVERFPRESSVALHDVYYILFSKKVGRAHNDGLKYSQDSSRRPNGGWISFGTWQSKERQGPDATYGETSWCTRRVRRMTACLTSRPTRSH